MYVSLNTLLVLSHLEFTKKDTHLKLMCINEFLEIFFFKPKYLTKLPRNFSDEITVKNKQLKNLISMHTNSNKSVMINYVLLISHLDWISINLPKCALICNQSVLSCPLSKI